MPSPEATVVVARSSEELEPYRAFFDAQHRHAACNLDTLVDEAGKEWIARPHVLILCRGAEPVAMIVGRLGHEVLHWHIGYKRLGGTKARLFRTVTGGILGDLSRAEDCDLLCDELMRFLGTGEADVAQIGGLSSDSALYRSMGMRPSVLYRDHFIEIVPHWLLSLPGSYDEFYKTRSSNTKSNIRQYKNRIVKRFGKSAEVRRYRSVSDIDRLMAEIESVAVKTYQRGIGVGFTNTAAVRRKWAYAAENGWFVAYVLYLEERPSAFWTGTIYKGIFMSEYTSFDPELSYYHPGMYVLLSMIEDFCREQNVQIIDFGPGDADYKRKFGTETVPEATLHVFAATLAGARLSLFRNGTMLVSHSAKRALGALGVTARLKAFWRKQLQGKDAPPSNRGSDAAMAEAEKPETEQPGTTAQNAGAEKANARKRAAHKPDTRKGGAPKPDAHKGGTPNAEARNARPPNTEARNAGAPKTDAHAPEASKPDGSTAHAQKSEAQKSDGGPTESAREGSESRE